MSLTLAQNPLRLVYDALWDLLEENTVFASLVKTGSRHKFTGTSPLPEPDSVNEADLPEVRVVLAGFKPHASNTSNSSRLTVTWQIQIASGDRRFETLLDVQWAIYCALHQWESHVKTITWNGTHPVKMCYADNVEETDRNDKLNRGIRGWSAVWQGTTDLWFDTSLVAAVGAT